MAGICFMVKAQNFKPEFSANLPWVIQYLFCGHACVYVDIKKISLIKVKSSILRVQYTKSYLSAFENCPHCLLQSVTQPFQFLDLDRLRISGFFEQNMRGLRRVHHLHILRIFGQIQIRNLRILNRIRQERPVHF